MAYIHINSPYSGDPVKIRDQDIGRAVRDGEGRVFYALPRSDGNGYYGSITRIGGPKEESQYLAMEAKVEHGRAVGEERSQRQVHDASGKRRGRGRMLVAIFLLIVLTAIAAAMVAHWQGYWSWQAAPPPAEHVVPGPGSGPLSLWERDGVRGSANDHGPRTQPWRTLTQSSRRATSQLPSPGLEDSGVGHPLPGGEG
ncbi:MAG: hypothetical protein WD042_14070 [Phycisphaeraceae bacterium]